VCVPLEWKEKFRSWNNPPSRNAAMQRVREEIIYEVKKKVIVIIFMKTQVIIQLINVSVSN